MHCLVATGDFRSCYTAWLLSFFSLGEHSFGLCPTRVVKIDNALRNSHMLLVHEVISLVFKVL